MTTPTLTGLRLTHYTLIVRGVTETPFVIQSLGSAEVFIQKFCIALVNLLPAITIQLLMASIDKQLSANEATDCTIQVNELTTLVIKHYRLGIEG